MSSLIFSEKKKKNKNGKRVECLRYIFGGALRDKVDVIFCFSLLVLYVFELIIAKSNFYLDKTLLPIYSFCNETIL